MCLVYRILEKSRGEAKPFQICTAITQNSLWADLRKFKGSTQIELRSWVQDKSNQLEPKENQKWKAGLFMPQNDPAEELL